MTDTLDLHGGRRKSLLTATEKTVGAAGLGEFAFAQGVLWVPMAHPR